MKKVTIKVKDKYLIELFKKEGALKRAMEALSTSMYEASVKAWQITRELYNVPVSSQAFYNPETKTIEYYTDESAETKTASETADK